ncbi:MAG TPA: PAS domain S-box protein [Chromobacteriaceae bacterium]|nr:PAS domain S-box protein [Chromobacteriaceae bacterium]
MSVIDFLARRRVPRLLWFTTAVTLLALMVALGGLFYLVYRDWKDEQQDNLIQEVLWLEQSLRLHMEGHQAWADTLASDVLASRVNSRKFASVVEFFIRENPEVANVQWVDTHGKVQWDQHGQRNDGKQLTRQEYDALWRAARLLRPSYSPPYLGADGKYRFDLAVPMIDDGKPRGGLRVIYQLDLLLYHQVPWWIASKNYISIQDLDGKTLASKFDSSEHPSNISHQTSFDPPGYGLSLKAVSYRTGLGLTLPVLTGLILLLAAALIYSVWRIRRHVRERSEAEHALAVEVSLRQAIEDCMKSGLVTFGLQGEIVRVNRAFCELLGYGSEELVGQKPPHSFWPKNDYPLLQAAMDAVRHGQQPELGFELRFQRKSGESIEVRLYATPLIEQDGRHHGWIATLFDITERKRQRLALNASHQRFLTVLNGLQAGVCVVDAENGQLLYANPTFAYLWLQEEPDAPCCVLLPGLAEAGGQDNLGAEFAVDEGQHWFQLHRRRIDWVNGEAAWLVILADITEDKEREAREQSQQDRFQNTSRLIAMGEMASSLAHELNQPLTAINTYAAGLMRRLPEDMTLPRGVREAVQAIAEQARRAGQIVNSIRAFVKKHEPQLEHVDPSRVVLRAAGLAESLASKAGVQLQVQQQAADCLLDMDPVLIEQVLLNLMKNAIEAMQDGHTRRPCVRVSTAITPAGWRVEVADNGPGLAAAIKDNLFTPFYSTKVEGMGIGLNICRSIVEFHRGQFGVESVPGDGCVFWFTLPLAAGTGLPPQLPSANA